jgi:hypothetical protein
MNDTGTIDDRRKALDEFAGNGSKGQQLIPPSVIPMQSPADRVFGAQKVAVYRDEQKILQRLAALGAAAGDDWFYRYPVKNRRENRTDWIEGPSIKLANDVARIYGNCDVDTRVIDLGDNWLIYARFTDFETGFSLTRPYQQRKNAGKIGGDDDQRRLDIAFQIGVSKAIRNVVVNALQTYADHAFAEAKNSLVEKIGKDIEKWRGRTIEALGRVPVDAARAERVIGRAAKDWLAPDIARIIAMMKAVADGMATADETFPPLNATPEQPDAQTGQTGEQPAAADTPSPQGAPVTPAPAANEPGSAQPSQQPSPSQGQPAAASAKAEPGDAAAKNGKSKTAAKGKDEPQAALPESETAYVAFANSWRERATDPAAAVARWKEEKNLRNKINVTPEVRDDLLAKLQAKCAALQKAEG